MNCKETTGVLSQYIDDVLKLPVRTEVDDHLDKCPVCRAHVVELRSLSRSLRRMSRPIAPSDLALAITDALMIESAAQRQTPKRSLGESLAGWLEPRLMPYSVGSLASLLLFVSMFVMFRPHFVALQDAARQNRGVAFTPTLGYDLTVPVSPADFSATRAPFAEQSPTLNPDGALAVLTSTYARPHANADQDSDDMIVVADVFSNGAASLADVVQAPRDRRMLADFELALRQSAAFVPASLDHRPGTMRVVFSVQKVDVHDRSF
jgi:hypothetical protein